MLDPGTSNDGSPVVQDKPKYMALYNEGDVLSNQASQDFIDQIKNETSQGFGFVPFIGAGFSVSAGIPIIRQLSTYLRRCICMALGLEEGDPEPWNPRTDQWPPFIDRERSFNDEHWETLVWKRYRSETAAKSANAALYQEAMGAMAEWRTSLHLLSRFVLTAPRSSTQQEKLKETGPVDVLTSYADGKEAYWQNRIAELPRVILGVPQQDVIDACFREVMRHKRPALAHKMLAAVSALLRIDLILTTNFDDLIEQAFEASRNPLAVFDVHLADRLPQFMAVSGVRSIIKLHGSQQSLRADYSLDGLPSKEDEQIFLEYLSGRSLRGKAAQVGAPAELRGEKLYTRNHLLVMGVGGSEPRTIQFLRSALRRFGDLKVFWVCHSKTQFPLINVIAKEHPQRIHVLRHTEVGLFLLHLYQSIRKTLPATGTLFPSNTRLSLPPLLSATLFTKRSQGDADPTADKEKKDFEDFVWDLKEEVLNASNALVVATADDGVHGLSSAGSEVFRRLESERVCVWLEMNDIQCADDLFEAFQEAAYSRLGEQDWTPLYAEKDNRPRNEEVARIAQSSINKWVLFLNAREVAGANRQRYRDDSKPNGWIDEAPSEFASPNDTANCKSFANLLREMVAATERLKIVLLCRGHDSNVLRELRRDVDIRSMHKWSSKNEGMSAGQTVLNVLRWADAEPGLQESRRRFVLTLACMQRPRYLATIWARCVRPDTSLRGTDDAHKSKWLDQLEEMHLLRRMDGGFIWFRSNVRQLLRSYFEFTPGAPKPVCDLGPSILAQLKGWNSAAELAQTHLALATWYRKIFDATATVPAVFEVIDHLCFSVRSRVRFWDRENLDGARMQQNDPEFAAIVSCIRSVRELLREQHFLIQAQGHPRLSMRRLDYVRDFWTDPCHPVAGSKATREKRESLRDKASRVFGQGNGAQISLEMAKLQSKAVETSMVLAREIGEEALAYERLREFGVRRILNHPCQITELVEEVQQKKETLNKQNGGESSEEPLTLANPTVGKASLGLSRFLTQVLREESGGGGAVEETTPEHAAGEKEPATGTAAGARKKQRTRKGEVIRWWRWCGILANASRSIGHADHSLSRALKAAKDDEITYWENDVSPLLALERLEEWRLSPNDSYKVNLEILHTLDVAAFHLTLRGHGMKRRQTLFWHEEGATSRKETDEKIDACMKRAELLARKGMQFVEEIQNSGSKREDHDFELQWCRSRLLMDAGLSMMFNHATEKYSRHAMSLLGDAALCLNSIGDERARSDIALVELRRAEIRLQEAGANPMPKAATASTNELDFQVWIYDRLCSATISDDSPVKPGGLLFPVQAAKQLKAVLDSYPKVQHDADASTRGKGSVSTRAQELAPQPASEAPGLRDADPKAVDLKQAREILVQSMRRVNARALDALRFLDRAEPLLRERRRNVWWTTWYFERRLRAISMLLWTAVVERDTPIPVLGLEAAMRKTDTEADVLLLDSLRMIRVDTYRLTMVLLEYASCARALQVRLALEPEAVRMPERLKKMRRNLERGLSELDDVTKRRAKSERVNSPRNEPEDTESFLRDTIRSATQRVRHVIEGLRSGEAAEEHPTRVSVSGR